MQSPSIDLALQSDWSRWVLEHGLPEPPGAFLAPDQSVPVAYWIGPDTAAVLHIRRYLDDDEGEDITETDIDLFLLDDGIWDLWGGGGGGWNAGGALARIDIPARRVALGGMIAADVGGRGCKALWGEVGTDAAIAEVRQGGQVTRRRVEAPTGAVVVSGLSDEPFTVRVFDARGELLADVEEPAGYDGEPL